MRCVAFVNPAGNLEKENEASRAKHWLPLGQLLRKSASADLLASQGPVGADRPQGSGEFRAPLPHTPSLRHSQWLQHCMLPGPGPRGAWF